MKATKDKPMTEQRKETYGDGIKAGEAAAVKWKREAGADESPLQRFAWAADLMVGGVFESNSHEDIHARIRVSGLGVSVWLFRALSGKADGEFERQDVHCFWEETIGIGGARLIEDDDFARGFIRGILDRK